MARASSQTKDRLQRWHKGSGLRAISEACSERRASKGHRLGMPCAALPTFALQGIPEQGKLDARKHPILRSRPVSRLGLSRMVDTGDAEAESLCLGLPEVHPR